MNKQYRRWVRVRVQGLWRAAFQSWLRAAAPRRHTVSQPEQLLLQRWEGELREGRGRRESRERAQGMDGSGRLGCICSSRGPGKWQGLESMKGDPTWSCRATTTHSINCFVREEGGQAPHRIPPGPPGQVSPWVSEDTVKTRTPQMSTLICVPHRVLSEGSAQGSAVYRGQKKRMQSQIETF